MKIGSGECRLPVKDKPCPPAMRMPLSELIALGFLTAKRQKEALSW